MSREHRLFYDWQELTKIERNDILVIAGGVIPPDDHNYLSESGVAAIFGPGTPITESAIETLKIMISKD